MMSFLLLLALLAGLANAEMPCSLYDVTTLRRGAVGSQFLYEIHSRTNAIGLRTNFTDITGLTDPLEDSRLSCYFNKSEVCPGWELKGFELGRWRINDPLLGWTIRDRYDYEEGENVRYGNSYANNLMVYKYHLYEGRQFRFRLFDNTKFFIGTQAYFPMNGLEFSSNSSYFKYQEKLITNYRYGEIQDGVIRGEVGYPAGAERWSVFARKVNDQVCIWMENVDNSTDCLFTGSNSDEVSVVVYDGNHEYVPLYISDSKAMQLIGTSGSAYITALPNLGSSREFCISLRYFLKKSEVVKVKFILDNSSRKVLYSEDLEGTGDIVSKQFSMIIPEWQDGRLQISFETDLASSFILRSTRKCSSKDRDVIIMKGNGICSTQICRNQYRSEPERVSKEVGFSLRLISQCIDPSPTGKICHNGGLNLSGWCLCPPGFTGHLCEKACPPGQFGADCKGVCVGSPDCKGISLASPGQPFECARGFTGPMCNETCNYGLYGPNCRLNCGKCLRGTCDRFSGLCNGPCKPGYMNRNCQLQLASVDSVEILSSTFTSAEGVIDITTLSDEQMKLYPIVKISYMKWNEIMDPLLWSSKFLPLNSRSLKFQLENLDHSEIYYVQAVLIHKSGDFYSTPIGELEKNKLVSVFRTDCFVCAFDIVDVELEEAELKLIWKVSDREKYPCRRGSYELQIHLPETAEPKIVNFSGDATNATVLGVFPQEGTIRLGVSLHSKDTLWTYHQFRRREKTEVIRNLNVLGESTRSIDFSWSSSDDMTEDLLVCQSEPVLCVGGDRDNKTISIPKGTFTLKGLSPFTKYKCSLENSLIEASTITQQDQPTGPPQLHDRPPQVTNTTASIHWKNADCREINGIPKGFRVELWRGKINEATTITTETTLETSFSDLLPETSYEARIYVVNQLGWNAAHALSIPFKTKSTTPNAVTGLLVYKRTRNDLWLRWTPPENDSTETVVVAYRVSASALGVENQTSETAPMHCPTWPEYFCYRLRSLIPDTEYTVEVQAKNDKVDLFGPSTLVKGITKEGVPEAPVDVRILNRTASSAVLTWEVPVKLNSNPKYFVVTLEQTDENDSQENPTDSLDQKVPIIEGQRIYHAKFDQLNAATTYVATISAGLRGQRSMLTINTPPKDPPAPPAPTVDETLGRKRIIFHGIRSKPDFPKLLSGYLLLAASNDTVGQNHGVSDSDVAASIQSHLADCFYVAHEFAPTLADEAFNFETEAPVPGNFSLIQNARLKPDREYRFALAAISTYCGANAVSVSPVLAFKT